MARSFNGKPTLVASLTQAITATLHNAATAADRIMSGRPAPGDVALLRAGEKALDFLKLKVVS